MSPARAFLVASTLFVAAICAPSTRAAELVRPEAFHQAFRDARVIKLEGVIEQGDALTLDLTLESLEDERPPEERMGALAAASLHSPGGNVMEGIALADVLCERAATTLVARDRRRRSACALAFLEGTGFHPTGSVCRHKSRLLEAGAELGFHPPSVLEAAREEIVADARAGARRPEGFARIPMSRLVRFFSAHGVSEIVFDHLTGQPPKTLYGVTTNADLYTTDVTGLGGNGVVGSPLAHRVSHACVHLASLRYFAPLPEADSGPDSFAISPYRNDIEPDEGAVRGDTGFIVLPVHRYRSATDGCSLAGAETGAPIDGPVWLAPLDHWQMDHRAPLGRGIAQAEMRSDEPEAPDDDLMTAQEPPDGFSAQGSRGEDLPVAPPPSPTEVAVNPAFDKLRAPNLPAAFEQAGPDARRYQAEGFAAVELRVSDRVALEGTYEAIKSAIEEVIYDRRFSNSYALSGYGADGQPLYVFGLRDGADVAVIALALEQGADGRATQRARTATDAVACSTFLGNASLPCAR